MSRVVMRTIAIAVAALGLSTAVPGSAQMFRDGYEFLKAVKDRDGDAVTAALNEPGSTVVNARDLSSGETALHLVTARRDLTWVRFLIQRGANPNIRDKSGTSPLQLAVRLGFLEGVEALIKGGADIDVNDSAGETPLIASVHRRDIPLVRLLLEKGASPDRTDNSGRSARDYVDLMASNKLLLDEFIKADEAREEAGETKSYGPKL